MKMKPIPTSRALPLPSDKVTHKLLYDMNEFGNKKAKEGFRLGYTSGSRAVEARMQMKIDAIYRAHAANVDLLQSEIEDAKLLGEGERARVFEQGRRSGRVEGRKETEERLMPGLERLRAKLEKAQNHLAAELFKHQGRVDVTGDQLNEMIAQARADERKRLAAEMLMHSRKTGISATSVRRVLKWVGLDEVASGPHQQTAAGKVGE